MAVVKMVPALQLVPKVKVALNGVNVTRLEVLADSAAFHRVNVCADQG